jgi:hypothetical protein
MAGGCAGPFAPEAPGVDPEVGANPTGAACSLPEPDGDVPVPDGSAAGTSAFAGAPVMTPGGLNMGTFCADSVEPPSTPLLQAIAHSRGKKDRPPYEDR